VIIKYLKKVAELEGYLRARGILDSQLDGIECTHGQQSAKDGGCRLNAG